MKTNPISVHSAPLWCVSLEFACAAQILKHSSAMEGNFLRTLRALPARAPAGGRLCASHRFFDSVMQIELKNSKYLWLGFFRCGGQEFPLQFLPIVEGDDLVPLFERRERGVHRRGCAVALEKRKRLAHGVYAGPLRF
jgi:hypothetical protein